MPNYHGKERWWTRERVLSALASAMSEIEGPLPCSDAAWNRIKKGRFDWPISIRVLEYFGSMARAWLSAGAPRDRVMLTNLPWSAQEETYLLEHAGKETLREIAKKLRRSYGSVRTRLNKNFKIAARANQGYLSAAELAKEFQCPYHRVRTALAEGVIPGTFDTVRNRWQVELTTMTPRAEAILKAPKLHSYKTIPTDLGDYYDRYGLKRTVIEGKVKVVPKGRAEK